MSVRYDPNASQRDRNLTKRQSRQLGWLGYQTAPVRARVKAGMGLNTGSHLAKIRLELCGRVGVGVVL